MGARLIRDLNPAGSSSPESIISIDGLLFFTADLGAGTTIEPPTEEDTSDSDENASEESDNANQGQALGQGIALLKSDGTAEGTKVLKEYQSINDLIEVNGELYFIADNGTGNRLWRSDGTARGTVLVKDLYPGADPNFPQDLFEIDGVLFYAAINSNSEVRIPTENGYELWRREGDGIGTPMFKNIIPDKIITESTIEIEIDEETGEAETTTSITTSEVQNDSFPRDFTAVNGNLFFSAATPYFMETSPNDNQNDLDPLDRLDRDIIGGIELWFSDGTESGTRPIIINTNSYNYYAPVDIEYGYIPDNLYDQDYGFTTNSASSFPRELTAFNNHLYFVANDGINGFELWKINNQGLGQNLVVDINQNGSSSPEELTVVGDNLYFTADNGNGRSLWFVDTSDRNIAKKITDSGEYPKHLTAIDNTLYYSAQSDIGRELWAANGSEAELLADISPGIGSSSPSNFTSFKGRGKAKDKSKIFFTANDGERGMELWSYDPNSKSLRAERSADIFEGPTSSEPRNLINADEILYFTADNGESGRELWTLGVNIHGPTGSTDGESSATIQVEEQTKKVFQYGSDSNVSWSLNGGDDSERFKINKKGWLKFNEKPYYDSPVDSNQDNIYQVRIRAKDQLLGTTSNQLVDVEVTALKGGKNQGNGTDENGGNSPDSEGKLLTSTLIKNINSGQKSSNPRHLTSHKNEALLFTADNGKKGVELWISKHSQKTTSLLKDINKGPESSNPDEFSTHKSQAYFSANNGNKGQELWVSDGTSKGTYLIADINSGAAGSSPSDLLWFNQSLFFAADDGLQGRELWNYDPSSQKAKLVDNIQKNQSGSSSNPTGLTAFNGNLYFAATGDVYGRELWRTTGEEDQSYRISDINPGGFNSNPEDLEVLSSNLYFTANTPYGERAIYKTDGTLNNFTELKIKIPEDLTEESENITFNTPENLKEAGGVIFYSATTTLVIRELVPKIVKEKDDDGNEKETTTFQLKERNELFGRELWLTDSTINGMKFVKDINTGQASSSPNDFSSINGLLYFSADDGVHGRELWVSDGTELGTAMVADINKGATDSAPRSITEVDGVIYFSARNDKVGRELWRLDDDNQSATRIVNTGKGKKKHKALDDSRDEFRFELAGQFGKRQADRITGFDTAEGDQLALGRDVFNGLNDIDLVTVTSKTQLATQSNNSTALIYFEPRGKLYFNQNGDASGYGEDGGLFAILKGGPDLSESAFRIL